MRTLGLGICVLLVACAGRPARAPRSASAEAELESRTAHVSSASSEDDVSYRDDEVHEVLMGIRDQLASCVPFSTEPFPIEIIVMPDGRLVRDDSGMMAQHIASCLDETLAAAHMPRAVRLGRAVTVDVAEVWRSPTSTIRPSRRR